MANGNEHWWDTIVRLGEGAVTAIAAAASAAMGWVLHRYRRDIATLAEHGQYIRQLKRKRVLSLAVEHAKLLSGIEQRLSETSKLADQMDDQIKAMGNVVMSLQGIVTNLTTLVETRGKEQHDLRELLQPIVMRLTLAEANIERLEKK